MLQRQEADRWSKNSLLASSYHGYMVITQHYCYKHTVWTSAFFYFYKKTVLIVQLQVFLRNVSSELRVIIKHILNNNLSLILPKSTFGSQNKDKKIWGAFGSLPSSTQRQRSWQLKGLKGLKDSTQRSWQRQTAESSSYFFGLCFWAKSVFRKNERKAIIKYMLFRNHEGIFECRFG